MGEHNIDPRQDEGDSKSFMKALLNDLDALEYMLEHDLIESGACRIGAEQEMFLVDHNLRPAPVAEEVLRRVDDPRMTTEIARFNLEANLSPLDLNGRCFSQMERELQDLIQQTRTAASECGADVILAGILPTLELSDLTLENLTPHPRYYALNRVISQMRGGGFSIHIKGLDELHLTHDNIMMESCNTSFQVHLQVNPAEFAPLYNWAQAITAPVLAAAVNSPLLFGHRLWQETRLALFQHSTDARSPAYRARSYPTRVGFGDNWLQNSVLELFREQIARFRPVIMDDADENASEVLARNEIPQLSALRMHNGTVWPWNRACYGVTNGRAHLRIENRVLPAGPTVLDEMANAAFFLGLMSALPGEYGDITKLMAFDDAKTNFFAAARHGLQAQLMWIGGKSYSASALILDHLLPLARTGLEQKNVESEDIDRYLGVIEERVCCGQTGAQWMLNSLSRMDGEGTRDIRHCALTAQILEHQQTGLPGHSWPLMEKSGELNDWSRSYQSVGQFMSTDMYTVRPDDLVDLAASMMAWKHIRHVPVEDDEGKLVGLISHRDLLRLMARGTKVRSDESILVREIMKWDPITVAPETPTLDAIELMRHHNVGCLPVVIDGRLVGIVTAHDFLAVSAKLFEDQLRVAEPALKR
jgi:CBS domain-containing protein/gamma-glutamylcysteine synthetase